MTLHRYLKWIAGLALLASLAVLAQGLWIPLKARLAYGLMERAFEQGQHFGTAQRPWQWADFTVTGKMQIDGRRIFVLSATSGEALAFGAGWHEEATPGSGGPVLSAHRDTHFAMLRTAKPGQRFTLQTLAGHRHYTIEDMTIIDTRRQQIYQAPAGQILLLTCWPFDALTPNTPLRYVVRAREVEAAL